MAASFFLYSLEFAFYGIRNPQHEESNCTIDFNFDYGIIWAEHDKVSHNKTTAGN